MARKRMITRTMTVTTAICLAVGEDGNPYEVEVDVVGSFKGKAQEKLLKAIKKDHPTAVYVKSFEEESAKYAMEEDDFLRSAMVLNQEDTYFHGSEYAQEEDN